MRLESNFLRKNENILHMDSFFLLYGTGFEVFCASRQVLFLFEVIFQVGSVLLSGASLGL
jgi:hypothetical protein